MFPNFHQHTNHMKRIEAKIDYLLEQGREIMSDLTNLQDQMKAVEDAVAALAGTVSSLTDQTAKDAAEIKTLLDQIAAGIGSGASAADLQALTARAQAVVASITTSNQQIAKDTADLAAAIPTT